MKRIALYLEDFRDLAFLHRKGDFLDRRVAQVWPHRLDHPLGTGTTGIVGVLFGEVAEIFRGS